MVAHRQHFEHLLSGTLCWPTCNIWSIYCRTGMVTHRQHSSICCQAQHGDNSSQTVTCNMFFITCTPLRGKQMSINPSNSSYPYYSISYLLTIPHFVTLYVSRWWIFRVNALVYNKKNILEQL